MNVTVSTPSLVLLIGVAGSGKSAFANRWFPPTAVVSSDFCRALISDDEGNQSVSADAFSLLHFIIKKRLKYNKLTVVDATNIGYGAREHILSLRDRYRPAMPAFAFVFDLSLRQCLKQNAHRPERQVEEDVIVNQYDRLNHSKQSIFEQDFQQIMSFESRQQVNRTRISLIPVSGKAGESKIKNPRIRP